MTFTATLPANVPLPEEQWLPARVRRHGSSLEVSADAADAAPELGSAESLKAWLHRCATQPTSTITDEQLDELRWEQLREKHQL